MARDEGDGVIGGGEAAAMAFGLQALVLTAAWRSSTGDAFPAETAWLACFQDRLPLAVVPVLVAGWLGREAVRAWGRGRRGRAGAFAGLALLVAADPLLAGAPRVFGLPATPVVLAMVLAAALTVRGAAGPRSLALRGVFVVAGMIAVDLSSDLPFIVGGRGMDLSMLNNTIHNGTLVHVLWLPLALGAMGVGLAGVLWRERDRRAVALLPLLALGGGLLYFVVEPAELALAACGADRACAAALLPRIGWSHLVSAGLLIVAIALLRRRAPARA